MNEKKDDTYYLKKISKDLHFIYDHTFTLTDEQIYNNELLIDSIMFRLIQISENASKLSVEYRETNFDWYEVKGLRNRIVHDYGNVDYQVIFKAIKDEIPSLIKIVDKLKK